MKSQRDYSTRSSWLEKLADQATEFIRLDRPANEEALCTIAICRAQESKLRGVLHSFCRHVQAEPVTKRHHGAHDGVCARLFSQARYEGPIDLDLVNR